MTDQDNTYIRIASLTIDNFKSVIHGELCLDNPRSGYDASVMGLYGQNGSGKTAVIKALAVLRQLLTGEALSEDLWECINVDADSAHLSYELQYCQDGDYGPVPLATASYEVAIGRRKTLPSGQPQSMVLGSKTTTAILTEKLSVSAPEGNDRAGFKKMPFVVTEGDDAPFLPSAKYELLIGGEKKAFVKLLAERTMAEKECRSFVFSDELLEQMARQAEKLVFATGEPHPVNALMVALLRRLKQFGQTEFFIVDAAQTGFVNLNALPLRLNSSAIRGVLFLPLNQATKMLAQLVKPVAGIIESLNIVLQKIVPGLTIELKAFGSELDEEGREVTSVQLISLKNHQPIPLQYESDGIKKIISILHLLVSMYNQKSVVVAVDELDSGIFEYLLGELMRIISEHGQGQLVFTSHNLRPLETISKNFIAFTTANPEKCYTQLKNVKGANNLRGMYFRNLMLNANENTLLYRPTDNFDIARAFRQAGKQHD